MPHRRRMLRKIPNQMWSWDITNLPSPIRGRYYYLYLIEDIYSRKALGWEVYGEDCRKKLRRCCNAA